MLKDGQKIILFSILGGISTWVVDALVDSVIFSKGPFWTETLIGDTHELYMRSLFMVVLIVFGILMAGFVARRKKEEQARIAAEQALHVSENRLHSVMESIADSVYLLDAEYRYVFMNKKHIERIGLSNEDYRGRAYSDFHSPEETSELVESVNTVLKTGDTIQKEHFSRKDNRYYLRTFSPVKTDGGGITAVAVDSKDITDLKELEDKLRNLSLTDELTGLYNRRGLFTMAEPLLKLACRQKSSIFLLYADLDNLK
jgi:PAS domain S-box-containing protein